MFEGFQLTFKFVRIRRQSTVNYVPYYTPTATISQADAQAICQANGQTLAIIENLADQVKLVEQLQKFTREESLTNQNDAVKYWIGLQRPMGVNNWTWRNENNKCKPPTTFWGINEPPGIDGGSVERNCVAIEVSYRFCWCPLKYFR